MTLFPVPVGVSNQVAVGDRFALAQRTPGPPWRWGRNDNGQVGNGTTAGPVRPGAVSTLGLVADVVAGSSHACARRKTGEVLWWRRNAEQQLGAAISGLSAVPVVVPGVSATRLAAGYGHTCAISAAGSLTCGGWDGHGQLATGGIGGGGAPTRVAGIADVVAVAAGGAQMCVLSSLGLPLCWGLNDHGPLGTGNGTPDRAVPTPVVDVIDGIPRP